MQLEVGLEPNEDRNTEAYIKERSEQDRVIKGKRQKYKNGIEVLAFGNE